MKPLNEEMTAQVHELAQLVGRKINRDPIDIQEQADPIIKALVRGGYSRLSDVNLQVRVESKVLDDFEEPAIHRRREVSALAGELQTRYEELVKWETNQPSPPPPPKAANISAFTDQ